MAALDEGGECHGLAFRIPAAHVERETEILWAREMLTGSYVAMRVPSRRRRATSKPSPSPSTAPPTAM